MITRALMSAVHSACQWRPAVACTSTGGQLAQRCCSGGANNSSDDAGSATVTAAVDVRPCGYDFGSPPSRGQVQLLIGPMFSGKSTELLRRVRRYQHARHKCLLIKSAKDGRYSQVHCVPPPRLLTRSSSPLLAHWLASETQTQVVTHDDHKNTGIPCISAGDALHDSVEVAERVAAADVVGIDEGHFFGDVSAEVAAPLMCALVGPPSSSLLLSHNNSWQNSVRKQPTMARWSSWLH